MGGWVAVLGSRRRGRLPRAVPRVVPVAAVRAGLFSVLGTTVASTVHHLAFDSSPSLGVRALAACLLFGVALPGAGHDKPLVRQLVLAVGSQLVVGYWFLRADPAVHVTARAFWPSSVHAGAPVVAAHVALTVLGAVLLHGVDTCRRRVLCAAARELFSRWFPPLFTPLDLDADVVGCRPCPGPAVAGPARLLLADSVVRRGPPCRFGYFAI